jgi:hypothetical protein
VNTAVASKHSVKNIAALCCTEYGGNKGSNDYTLGRKGLSSADVFMMKENGRPAVVEASIGDEN